jgi:copper chaperone NosL
MMRTRTFVLVTGTLLLMLSGCAQKEQAPAAPLEISQGTSCSLDGMLLADFPGPKAQIQYAQGPADFFCDTVEMFSIYLRPEQQKRVRALYVQDMGKADWQHPQGHWIDARTAFYVQGSKLKGSMGATFVSFAEEAAAKAFIEKNGGKLYRFSDITPDMAALDGGALHDQRM